MSGSGRDERGYYARGAYGRGYDGRDWSGRPVGRGGYTGYQAGRMVGQVADQARAQAGDLADQARDRAGEFVDRAREQAGGLVDQARGQASGFAEQAREQASGLVEQAGDFADQTRDRFGEVAGQARGQVGQFTSEAEFQAWRARYRAEGLMRSNPLAVGALALAAGVAVGLAVPETEPEHRLMGEARDSLVGQATAAAQQAVETVGQAATGAASGEGAAKVTPDAAADRPEQVTPTTDKGRTA
jgi:uncharacterized protein YjbJ (UPF0337 family)